jgi:DnaJ-class molecular chaperone
MIGQTTDLTYSDSITVASMLNVIGVGSDASDTNLQVFHNDGSGTCTKIDLGSNFPANRTSGAALTTTYSIELFNANAGSTVIYKVTNNETGSVAEGTISTDLPANTQGLNFTASRCMGTAITNTGQFDLTLLGVYSL